MRRFIVTGLVLANMLIAFSQEIVQWRGEKRDGIYPCKELLTSWPEAGPTMLWHYDDLGAGFTSATVSNDLIYITGTHQEDGFLYALTQEGKLVWKVTYGKEWVENFDGSRTSPMLYNGKLYLMSGLGVVYCFSAAGGKLIWSVDLIAKYDGRNITFGMTENLLIHNNKLFVAAGGEINNLMALNIETGELIWSSKCFAAKSSYCSPLVVNHNGIDILVTHIDSNILGVNPIDGSLMWNFEFKNRYDIHPNTPIYKDGMLFCFSGYGKGGVMLKLSADGKSVSQVWENSRIDNQMGGAVLIEGKLYLTGQNNKKMFCVDWMTGKEIMAGAKQMTGTTIAADGLIYTYAESGMVHLIKPTSSGFELVSEFKIPYGEEQHWAHLVINKKRLFVRHGTSLMVYDIAKK